MSNSVQLSMMTTNIESVTVMLKRRKDRVKNGLPDLGEDLGQAVTRVTGWRCVWACSCPFAGEASRFGEAQQSQHGHPSSWTTDS